MNNYPISRKSNIVVQELANEILIYDLKINKAYCLNETSAQIWQLCDGTRTVAEISRSLSNKLKQLISEDLIWLALDDFKRDNLLEQNEDFAIDFNGLTRRQVIRKIGLASMVVLPLIASVISPTAAMAQSGGFSVLTPCSSSSQCASKNCLNNSGTSLCCTSTSTINGFPGVPISPLTFCSSAADCAPFVNNCCGGKIFCSGNCVCGF